MTPKQRNYNGYSLVHPHSRIDPNFSFFVTTNLNLAPVTVSPML